MALSKEAKGILAVTIALGSLHILAEEIVQVAELISAGYIRADDDYGGPRLIPTEKGINAAKRWKIIELGDNGSWRVK